MQDKCAQAVELLGLHKKARQVQPLESNSWQQENHVSRSDSTKARKDSNCTNGNDCSLIQISHRPDINTLECVMLLTKPFTETPLPV